MNYLAVWDYHVIVILKHEGKFYVFDRDSNLWGVSFPEYFLKALKTQADEPPTVYRVIKAT